MPGNWTNAHVVWLCCQINLPVHRSIAGLQYFRTQGHFSLSVTQVLEVKKSAQSHPGLNDAFMALQKLFFQSRRGRKHSDTGGSCQKLQATTTRKYSGACSVLSTPAAFFCVSTLTAIRDTEVPHCRFNGRNVMAKCLFTSVDFEAHPER